MADEIKPKTFYDRMLLIDRRWIFLLLALLVGLVYLLDLMVPVYVTAEVRNIYDRMESLNEGDVILLAMDYDPSTLAELHPMTYTVLSQAYRKGVNVLVTALHQNGPGMADQAIRESVARYYAETGDSIRYGTDLVFLGYKPYPALVINSLGQDFHISFPQDYYNTSIDSLPLTQRVHNLTDVKAIVNISGTSATDTRNTFPPAETTMTSSPPTTSRAEIRASPSPPAGRARVPNPPRFCRGNSSTGVRLPIPFSVTVSTWASLRTRSIPMTRSFPLSPIPFIPWAVRPRIEI